MLKEDDGNVPVLVVGGVSDIHYDEPKKLNNSIHRKAYKSAIGITEEIIRDTQKKNGNDNNDNNENSNSKGTGLRNREQVCNIIFFTGDKGTGKTSSMLSYMEFLKDYYRNTNRKSSIPEEFRLHGMDDNNFMFTGIDYIDASALNGQEDILGNVLAKMLNKWKKEEQRSQMYDSGIVRGSDYDYKKRQLRVQFSEIYNRLKELRSKDDAMDRDSDMFIEAIESMSFSANVKKSFQSLVDSYLKIMVYPEAEGNIGKDNHYLVISIDDLDMNVQSGFQLLEQIRKYLMVPRVLILMSANYEQLEKICYNHYWREFEKVEKSDENQKYMRKLSREYLEKMVPVQRQIALLSNEYWEYFYDKEIKIECNSDNNNRLYEELCKQDTLFNIVSNCMKKCFGVRFGLDKKSISYLAPGTIRETCSWVHQMSNLYCCCGGTSQVDLNEYEYNANWFWQDEFPRLCKKYLDADMQNIMRLLETLEPYEQVKKLRTFLCEKMNQKSKEPLLKLLNQAKCNEQIQNFAYLCVIYLNMKLSDIMVRIKESQDGQSRNKAKELLMQYYTTPEWGIWGAWEDKMITMPNTGSSANQGNNKVVSWVNIARNTFINDNGCFAWDVGPTSDMTKKENVKAYFTKNAAKIIHYQCYLLFYSVGTAMEMGELEFYFDDKQGKFAVTNNVSGTFSLSGFVLNIIAGAPLLKQFQSMIDNVLIKYGLTEKETICNKIFLKVNENDLLMPIDNIDFLMYLGKEIQKKLGYPCKEAMDQSNVVLYMKQYFQVIYECLKEYDKEMAERFSSFLSVRKVMEKDAAFTTNLFNGIKAHLVTQDLQIEDDWSGSN